MKQQSSSSPNTVIIRPERGLGRLGLGDVWEFRDLLKYLILRDIRGRYRPMSIGPLWIIIRPICHMLVYSFVFGKLFGVRSGDVPYPVYVYSGIILWLFFSASVSKASSGLVANRHMMNKVYFPRMVAPLVYIGSETVDLCASFIVLFIMMAFYKVTPGLSILALPFFVCLVILAGTAFGLWLAALSVKVRDVSIALPIGLMAWMYLSPVVYPISLIPDSYLSMYYLNPMAVIFQGYRWALFGATHPPFTFLLGTAVLIGIGLVAAIYYFRHTERTMVDFL